MINPGIAILICERARLPGEPLKFNIIKFKNNTNHFRPKLKKRLKCSLEAVHPHLYSVPDGKAMACRIQGAQSKIQSCHLVLALSHLSFYFVNLVESLPSPSSGFGLSHLMLTGLKVSRPNVTLLQAQRDMRLGSQDGRETVSSVHLV